MSSHSSKFMESDVKSIKSLLKKLSKDIQSISSKQLENETKTNELTKAKDEKSQISNKLPSHASISKDHDSFGEGSLRIKDYYQVPPRRYRRDRREQESPREARVDCSRRLTRVLFVRGFSLRARAPSLCFVCDT